MFAANWQGYFRTGHAGEALEYETPTYRTLDSSRAPLTLNEPAGEAALKDFQSMLAELRARNRRVYVILSSPRGPNYDPARMFSRISGKLHPSPVHREEFRRSVSLVVDRVRTATLSAGAIVLDPTEYLCDGDVCATVTADGRPVYKDSNHLRPFFAAERATYIDAAYVASPTRLPEAASASSVRSSRPSSQSDQ